MSISINEVKSPRPNLIVSEVNEIGTLKVNSGLPNRSSNFGPGADLLMNQGRASRQNSPKSEIKLSDLNGLDSIDSKPKTSSFIIENTMILESGS